MLDTFRASGFDDEGAAASGAGSARVPVTDVPPTIVLGKTASPNPIDEPGGPVTYTATVRNDSPETLTLTSLADDVEGDLDGVGTCAVPQAIAAGATYTCTWPGSVSGDAGDVRSNILTARVRDDEGTAVVGSVQADVIIADVLPLFRVSKSAAPGTLPEPGGPVTFTVTLVNDSRENVTLDSFVDAPYGDLNGKGTCRLPQTLTPNGGFYTCTFRETVTGTAADSPYVDTVTAAVSDNDGNQAEGGASAEVVLTDVLPSISVTKTASPTSRPEPGGAYTFTVAVTNTAVEPVTLSSLVDDVYGDIADAANPALTGTTCSLPQPLAVGGSYSCTFSVSFTGNPRTQRDVVTATASDDEGDPASATDDATIAITNVPPIIGVTKTASPTSLPEPGGPVAFTFGVRNLSTIDPLTITSLTDTVFGTLTGDADCQLGTVLAPGASCSFGATFTVTGSTASGPHRDTFRARGRDDDTTSTVTSTATATVTFTDVLPSIGIEKSAAPLTLPEPGGPFTFSLTVTNASVEPITLTSLVDVPYGPVTQVQGEVIATTCSVPRSIPVGGSYGCSFTATFAGDAGDSQTDLVTATARDDEANPATASDDATVSLTDVLPSMSVTKSPSPASLPEPGGPVVFTFTVTNTSAVDALAITSLADSDFSLSGDADCQVGSVLAPLASCTFTQTETLVGDASGPAHEDTFTAAGEDGEGNPTSASADATVVFTDVLPAIGLTKTPDPTALPEPGGAFDFALVVSNASVEPVTLTSLGDDVYGDVTVVAGDLLASDCVLPVTIPVGGAYACTFRGTFTGNALDSQTDTVSAAAADDEGNPASAEASATVELTDVPSAIELTKEASPTTVPEPGAVVTFSLQVANTSPVDSVTLESLVDDLYGDVTVVAGAISATTCALPVTIPVGGSYGCTFEAFTAGNAGDVVTDTVTASGSDDDGLPVSDTDDAEVTVTDVLPAIGLTKTPDPTALPEPGGAFDFALVVSNASVEPVTLTSLGDDVYGDVTVVAGDLLASDCVLPVTIPVGGAYACTFRGTFTGNALDSQTDTVSAAAADDEGNPASAEASATVELTDVPSAIELTKEASPTTVPEPGAVVTFSLQVANTSPVDSVTLESLVDDLYGDVTVVAGAISATTCALPVTIPVGGSYGCTFEAFTAGNAGDVVTDTVTASGSDDDGLPVSDTDDAEVTVTDVLPAIGLTKTPDPTALPEPGGAFDFALVVSNASVEPVTLTSLGDDVYGDVTVVAGDLLASDCVLPVTIPVGGAYACTFRGTFTGNALDSQTDTVSAAAADDEGNPASAEASATVELTPVPPVIVVTKTPRPTVVTAPGGDVTFSITVANESTFEAVTLDALVDDVYGDLNGTGECLADGSVVIPPGGTYGCQFTERVSGTAGETHRDTVTATASDDDPLPSVVAAAGAAVVPIVAPDRAGQPATDTLAGGNADDDWGLVRMLVLLLSGSVIILALGWGVARRSRP